MTQKPLNLDELFGTKDPVQVVYQGKTYELARPDAWTPSVYSKYISLQKKMTLTDLESATEDPAIFEKLAEIVRQILEIVSPEMSKLDLSFEQQSTVIGHYANIVFPEEMAQVKAKNLTGA